MKILGLLMLLTMATLGGHCQRATADTVCIPVADAKAALKRIAQGKADSATLVVRLAQIKELQEINAEQKTALAFLRISQRTNTAAIEAQQQDIANLQTRLTKAKRKTKIAALGALIAGGAIVYLFKR